MSKYADSAQKEELKKLDEQIQSGKLDHVTDTPAYWKLFTTIEIDYILSKRKERTNEYAKSI